MKKKLEKRHIDSAEYQNLPLKPLRKQLDSGNLSQETYDSKLEKFLAPYRLVDKTGKIQWRPFILWDETVTGLGLRIASPSPRAKKVFIVSYRWDGKKRFYRLGEFGQSVEEPKNGNTEIVDLTLHFARKRAKRFLAPLDGDPARDPLAVVNEKAGKPLDEQAPQTVLELCRLYLANHSKPFKKPKPYYHDQRRIKRFIEVPLKDSAHLPELPRIGNLKPEDLVEKQVEELYQAIGGQQGEKRYEANQVLVLLSAVYTWAIRRGYLPGHFRNPAKLQGRYKEKERARIIQDDELPKLVEAIEAEPDPFVRGLFKLLMLTGLRRNEVLHARWFDLDVKGKKLRLQKTKRGNERVVPLSGAALEVIRSLPRFVGRRYIFPAHYFVHKEVKLVPEKAENPKEKPDKPMANPRRQWDRIREKAGCPDLRLHDLRRSASVTVIEATGSPKAAQKVLGHAQLSTTLKHYAVATEAVQEEAVESLARRLSGEN